MKRRTLLTGSLAATSSVALGSLLVADRPNERTLSSVAGTTMGTFYRVHVPRRTMTSEALRTLAEPLLAGVNSRMSTYRSDSELEQFNAGPIGSWSGASAPTLMVMEKALEVGAMTDGAFDPTVGPLVELWGFGPSRPLIAPPPDEKLADAARLVGFTQLRASVAGGTLSKQIVGLRADLGGIAKGFAVDRIATRLDATGVENYLIDVGGEVRGRGHHPAGRRWRVGIEMPVARAPAVHGVIPLEDAAVATSGDYRNFFVHGGQRYAHTIDARTACPVTHTLASVSVVADDAMTADALSTALMVMGPEEGYEFARMHNLAALFLVRAGGGIRERATAAFSIRQA